MASIFDGYRPDEMIQGGFSGLGQVGHQAYQGYQHEQDLNKPLHPLAQQLLQQLLGQQAQQPQQPQQAPQQAPDQQPIPYGPSQPQGPGPADIGRLMNRGAISDPVPQMSAQDLTAPYQMPGTNQPPTPPPPPDQSAGPSQGGGRMSQPMMSQPASQVMTSLGGQSRPLTNRDLATFQALAPLIAAQTSMQRNNDTLQTRRDIAALADKGKGDRSDKRLTQNNNQFEDRQKLARERMTAEDQRHKDNLTVAMERLGVLRKALGQKNDDKSIGQLQKALDSARGIVKAAINADSINDPGVSEQVQQAQATISEVESQLKKRNIGGVGNYQAPAGPAAPGPATANPGRGYAPGYGPKGKIK